jgi:hypothetical protein
MSEQAIALPSLPAPLLETNGDVFGHDNAQGFTAEQMQAYALAERMAERERCAKFVEEGYERQWKRPWREDLAAALRSGMAEELASAIRDSAG